jgi:hypothetical protein
MWRKPPPFLVSEVSPLFGDDGADLFLKFSSKSKRP